MKHFLDKGQVIDNDLIITDEQRFLFFQSLAEQYKILRQIEYLKLNQNELRYNDLINGTNTWIEAIQEIKEKYPKPKELQNV